MKTAVILFTDKIDYREKDQPSEDGTCICPWFLFNFRLQ